MKWVILSFLESKIHDFSNLVFFSLNLLGKGMKETDDQDRVKHLEKKFSMKIQQGLKMKLVPSCKIRAYY